VPVPEPVQKEVEEPVQLETPKVESAVEPKIEVKPQQKPEQKPAPVTQAPAPVASGSYYIQLASVKSADGAEIEWKKLQKKYTGPLAGLSHRVQKAELGEKGTFYRIQAGPVAKDQASRICSEIKKITPGGCLVKK
ncbi:MAG: SPOR domain-containing protein, partial [Alphaproteobacteria bacterium]|nr:SPOR domain-containing protein [Alphaproteobacteria bacterium]